MMVMRHTEAAFAKIGEFSYIGPDKKNYVFIVKNSIYVSENCTID